MINLGAGTNTTGQNENTQQQSHGAINLTKGAKINLTKEAPGLKKVIIGLGWQTQKYSGSADFDLDASAFLVDKHGRTNEDGFIFYGNLQYPNGSVVHQGDNKIGGDGISDDEQIVIDLDAIPENIEKVAIAITIYDYERRGQNFGMVDSAYCRLVNAETGKEEYRFNLGEDFSVETAVVVGEIYRYNGEWKFNTIGSGFDGGLIALCKNYGLDAEYK